MSKTPEIQREAWKKEGSLLRDRVLELVQIGRPIVEESNLRAEACGTPFTKAEVEAAIRLIQALASDPKQAGTLKHSLITGSCAGLLTEQLMAANPLDPEIARLDANAMRITGYLHETGRTATHRYGINDAIGDRVLLRRLGIREDILELMPSLRPYTRRINPAESFQDLSLTQRILDIADLYSKPRYGKKPEESWTLPFDEVLRYHKASRSKYADITKLNPLWPTEEKAFQDMTIPERGIIDRAARLYEETNSWLKSKGVDFESIRQNLEREEEERGVVLQGY